MSTVVFVEVSSGDLRDRAVRLLQATGQADSLSLGDHMRLFALVDVAEPDNESLQAAAVVEPLIGPGWARLTGLATADGAPAATRRRLLDEVVLAVCGVAGGRLVGRLGDPIDLGQSGGRTGQGQRCWSRLDEWLASGGETSA
jgi:hypothetical protein